MNANSNSNPIKFGTDGWRAIVADEFTFANVRKVTRAIAAYLEATYSKTRPVLIGYDTRFLADKFARVAANIIADLGWQVFISDRDCPTPAIAYQVRHQNAACAIHFTASHNPPHYCGMKYIPDYAGPATPDITDRIATYLPRATDAEANGNNSDKILTFNPKSDYLNFLYSQLDLERIRQAKLKVKYDALYSTTRGYLDEGLAHCGCDVETLHGWRDVLFGGGMPQPSPEYLGELIQAVKTDQADVGLATDGDGDRFGIIDENGNFVSPNQILLLLARHLVKNKGKTGAIVRSIATTHLLDNFAHQHGLPLYETPVGFKYIGEKMRETNVLIGGEESGGLSVFSHIPQKDGILSNLLVLEAIAYEGKPLSELVKIAETEAGGSRCDRRLDLPVPEQGKAEIIASISQDPPDSVAGLKVTDIKGKKCLKLHLEDGSWVLIRPSGSQPLMRLYVETDSPEKETKLIKALEQWVQD